jgi:apolipoprotein D and lipocalin family protein
MKRLVLLRVILACLACLALPVQADTAVVSVPAVDLNRYLGKWYEIAGFPMFFQRSCLGDTTAEYGLRPDRDISVNNRCRKESGFDGVVGKAWVVADTGNSQLKVQFFWPFRADYWVIGLDADYRWAVVGNPNRKYLWILSRTPRLPQELLDQALKAAEAQDFDLTQLHYTVHGVAAGTE